MKTLLKIATFTAILFGLTTSTFAQTETQIDTCDFARPPLVTVDSTFDLSAFILPDYRRRELTTNYGLSNNFHSTNNHSRTRYFDENLNDREFGEKDLRNRFFLEGSVAYSDIHYTRKHQKETYMSSNIKFNAERYKKHDKYIYESGSWNTDLKTKGNSFNINPSFSFSQVNRRYLNENLFVGYSPSVSYNFPIEGGKSETAKGIRNGVEIEKNNAKSRQFAQYLSPRISLEIGLGRIEPVGDARDAIYIFDALARRGVTSASKTSDEIIRFAEFIAELRNKRYLDARHRRIYETEMLDSFLFANGHRDTLTIEYITTLSDFFWFYGTNRSSGKRWTFYTAPSYDFRFIKTKNHQDKDVTQDSYQHDNILHTRFGINFAYEKPINLYWQNSFSSSLEYHQQNIRLLDKNKLTDEKQTLYGFQPSVSYSISQRISYFPTTRTSAYAGYGLRYRFYQQPSLRNSANFTHTYDDLSAEIIAGASYFFSPQLRLNFDTSLRYYYNEREYQFDNFYYITNDKQGYSIFYFYLGLSVNYTFY
jgi:hypothetical protein